MSIDGDSSSLQRDVTDVSEARKRRNRSTRRPRSADVRSSTTEHQQWEEGVRSTSRLDEGGEEDSMHSGSVTSTSARFMLCSNHARNHEDQSIQTSIQTCALRCIICSDKSMYTYHIVSSVNSIVLDTVVV